MLTWLLEVEDCYDSLLFELLNDGEFLDKTIAQALRADQKVSDPLRVKASYGWILALKPVFMLAPLTHAAEGTMY
jgi:hypothetical protein